jgi:hypothetical protein
VRVAPTIWLVIEHSRGSRQSSIYSVPTRPLSYDPQMGPRSMATALLSPSTLPTTLKHAAQLAGLRNGYERVYAGVSTYSSSSREWRVYLAELKVP